MRVWWEVAVGSVCRFLLCGFSSILRFSWLRARVVVVEPIGAVCCSSLGILGGVSHVRSVDSIKKVSGLRWGSPPLLPLIEGADTCSDAVDC